MALQGSICWLQVAVFVVVLGGGGSFTLVVFCFWAEAHHPAKYLPWIRALLSGRMSGVVGLPVEIVQYLYFEVAEHFCSIFPVFIEVHDGS